MYHMFECIETRSNCQCSKYRNRSCHLYNKLRLDKLIFAEIWCIWIIGMKIEMAEIVYKCSKITLSLK